MERPAVPGGTLDSMLDDQTTSRWIGHNKFGLPVQEASDWDNGFEAAPEPYYEEEAPDSYERAQELYRAAQFQAAQEQQYQAALQQQAEQQYQYQAALQQQAEQQYQAALQYQLQQQAAQQQLAQEQYYAAAHAQVPQHYPREQRTLRRWPAPVAPPTAAPAAATSRTMLGHGHGRVSAPLEVAVQASEFRSEPFVPFWFRTLVPGLALFGAMLFAAVILFVDPPASLTLKTEPPDAELTVDGRRVEGSSSPFFVGDLAAGEHVVVVRKPGFEEQRKSFQVAHGEALRLPSIQLQPSPEVAPAPAPEATGGVIAPPQPMSRAAARAAARAERAAARTNATRAATAPIATAQSPAPRPARLAPEESPGKPDKREVVAAEEAAPRAAGRGSKIGMLRINTRPWSKVYVDGKFFGTTPQLGLPLPAGQHRVELVNDEMDMRKTIQVTIKANEIETKVVNLLE